MKSNQPSKHSQKIAVIGGGLGGLAAAVLLAERGHSVVLFEKNKDLGGKIGEFECTLSAKKQDKLTKDNFRFDTGPSLFTMRWIFEEFFTEIGSSLDAELSLLPLDPICRYIFSSGACVDSHSDIDTFAHMLSTLHPSEGENLKKFLNYSQEIYDFAGPLFLKGTLTPKLLREISFDLKLFSKVKNLGFFTSMHKKISSFFITKEAQQLFGRYATYSGSSPYSAPSTLNLIPFVEHTQGAYYVKGGIKQIITRLVSHLKARQVEIHTEVQVENISLIKNGALRKPRIASVIDSYGLQHHVDAVVVNSDVTWAHKYLLKSSKFSRCDPSTSGLVLLWGIKGETQQLAHHNILFSSDYKMEFHKLAKEFRYPDDFTTYVNISSKSDPDDAPVGHENWFILINAPAFSSNTPIFPPIEKIRSTIFEKLERLGIFDIKDRVLFETVITPNDFKNNYFCHRGSLYGPSSNTKKQAFLRQPAVSELVDGLFFAGGTVHPGGGMPLALLSGRNAANAASHYLKRY
jgi:phytoene desaturase